MPVGCCPPWPKGDLPPRADPAVAAVVALRLLGERLEEAAHELVAGEALELRQGFGGEVGEVLGVAQPLEHLGGDVVAERALDALEDAEEDAVVGVEVGLALDQAGACQVVEAEQARSVQSLLERVEKRAPLLDADRHPFGAEPVEEVEEQSSPYWL